MSKQKKLYRPLIIAVNQAIYEIFKSKTPADKFLAEFIKSNKKWGGRDRRFIAENVYGLIRNYRLASYCVDLNVTDNSHEEVYEKLAAWLIINEYEVSDFEELENPKNSQVLIKYKEAQEIRKVKESIPDWVDLKGEESLGEKWDSELAFLNTEASVYLRPNLKKASLEKLHELLLAENVECSIDGEAIKISKRFNFNSNPLFKKGYFEVQDKGSQLLMQHLTINETDVVIDACAGAGGKSLQIANERKDKGQIIALDINKKKIVELEKRVARNRINSISSELISDKVLKKYEEKADVLLLDVPCSGLGVLRRKPWAKWQMTEKKVGELIELQEHILENYTKLLKPGGQLLYATCSILKDENQDQVAKFLMKNPNYTLEDSGNILSSENDTDSFFYAKFIKQI